MKRLLLAAPFVLSLALAGCTDGGGNASGSQAENTADATSTATEQGTASSPAAEPQTSGNETEIDIASVLSDMQSMGTDGERLGAAAKDAVAKMARAQQAYDLIAGVAGDNSEQAQAIRFLVGKEGFEKFQHPGLGIYAGSGYANGFGTAKNLDKAMEVLSSEVLADNAVALFQRAKILMDVEFGGFDTAAGRDLLEKSAAKDYAPAKEMLTGLAGN